MPDDQAAHVLYKVILLHWLHSLCKKSRQLWQDILGLEGSRYNLPEVNEGMAEKVALDSGGLSKGKKNVVWILHTVYIYFYLHSCTPFYSSMRCSGHRKLELDITVHCLVDR